MTRDRSPGKPEPRSHTLRRAATRLRRAAPPARGQDDGQVHQTAGSALEELLGRYRARPLPYTQMMKTDVVTARIPIAADPMLGSVLVQELTMPFSLSIGAFPWDAEPPGRGKKVGNWLHRHYVLGKRDVYARLHHRYVLFDDLDEETWPLVGRTRSLRSALQRAEVVTAGHLDEPAMLATVNATLWDVAQRCARLTSLRRAREGEGAYDAGGLLPAQTVQQTGEALAEALTALNHPIGDLEELARHVLDADDHYRAWKTLQALAGRGDDFVDLAAADTADRHHTAAWGGHFAQARATAATLAASIDATRSFLEDHGLAATDRTAPADARPTGSTPSE